MALPSSGTISILDLAREKVYDNHADDRIPYTGGSNKFPYPLDGFAWVTTGNNCTLSQDTGQGIGVAGSGNSALKMVCTGTDSYTNTHGTTFNHGTAGIGQTWTFSVYAKASTSLTGQLFLFEAPDGGSYTQFTNTSISITTDWQRFEVTRTLNQASTETVRVRVDGPQGNSSETVYWDGFQIEQASSATNFSMNGPYSMYDLINAGGEFSSISFDATNTAGPYEPNTSQPHAMSDWYGYDHDWVPAPSAQILLHSNGSDPGSADSYSTNNTGLWYSPVYRVVITYTAGSTNIVGNDSDFGLAAEGGDTTPDNYAVSTSAKTIAVQYTTFYFRVRRDIEPQEIGADTVTIGVTPAGSGVTTDSIAITVNWDTIGGE